MSFRADSIANTISAIKVGYLSNSKYIIVPTTKCSRNLIIKLEEIGAISHFEPILRDKILNYWKIYLSYNNKLPSVSNIRLISTRSKKYPINIRSLCDLCKTRKGVALLSTNIGLLTNLEAANARVGGILILWVTY